VKILSVYRRSLCSFRKLALVPILLTVSIALFANCSSRTKLVLDRPISVDLKEKNLRDALFAIEQEADVKFLFQSQVVSPGDEITLYANEKTLGEVLSEVLGPRKIQFEVDGNQIILTRIASSNAE
jgi:TonB-dependent starch-binding outer membrane protein SusC